MNRKLFPYQKEGVNFLIKKKKAILADSMGLGKTLQAITAAGTASNGTILIVCPASLKINWEREIHMVYPEDIVSIIDSGFPVGDNSLLRNAAWLVINYDILSKHLPDIVGEVKNGTIETVIFDEAHYIKDTKTIRTKAALSIAEHAAKVYCLTGTPVMNRPIELFSLLTAIDHPLATAPLVSRSALRRAFSQRYCDGHMRTINMRGGRVLRFWEEKGADRLPELKALIKSSFLRRTKEEVLDLPPKIVSVVDCELDRDGQLHYDSAWHQYLETVAHSKNAKEIENILDSQQLVELMKLKQVCSNAKVPRIAADIENAIEQGEKVIVFSQFTQTIHDIADTLRSRGVQSVTLTGANDMEERQTAVDLFQNDPDVKVFVANIKAGGVGLNLTAASIVIFADLEWSPELHNQASDRAHRIGQTGTVNVYYYILKNTIEEDIVDILLAKQETIGTLTGGDTVIQAFMDIIIEKVKQ